MNLSIAITCSFPHELGMENYKKLKSQPIVEARKEVWDIFVSSGSKVKAVISKGMKLLEETKEEKIVLTGFGPTVSKTITCAEIIKRRKQNLYQNNKLFYKKKYKMVFHVYGIHCDKDKLDVVKLEKSVTASQVMEDTWEPKQEGLDRLTVTRNVPAIKIVLSKIPLDVSEPGYQRPLNVTGKRKTPNVKRNGRNHERKCEKYVGSKPLNEPSGRSSSNTQNKEKIPKTKRFRSSHDK